jgi:hypothetical protein
MKKILLLFIFLVFTLFSPAQNVGIGTVSPSEKLEVVGNIKADNFKYSTTKTFFHTFSGFNFRAENSTDTVLVSIAAGEITMQTNLTGKKIVAPLQLPDGATLVNLKAYINDFSVNQDLRVMLNRKTLTDNFFATNYGSVVSSGATGLGLYQTSIFTNVIDNSLYTYYLSVGSNNATIPFPGNIYLRAVIIEYTKTTTQ